jgi:hypothetical protein
VRPVVEGLCEIEERKERKKFSVLNCMGIIRLKEEMKEK